MSWGSVVLCLLRYCPWRRVHRARVTKNRYLNDLKGKYFKTRWGGWIHIDPHKRNNLLFGKQKEGRIIFKDKMHFCIRWRSVWIFFTKWVGYQPRYCTPFDWHQTYWRIERSDASMCDATSRTRNALIMVDFPALLLPVKTLRRRRSSSKSSIALYALYVLSSRICLFPIIIIQYHGANEYTQTLSCR